MQLLRKWHDWTGALLSIIVVILGLSGSLLVFKNDYVRLTVLEGHEPILIEPTEIGAAMNIIEAQYGSENLSYVSLAKPNLALHRIVLKDGRVAYADQTGNTIEVWEKNARFEDWLFDLHHYLLLGKVGKLTAGIVGFLAIFMIVSGLIIVYPTLRKFNWKLWPRSFKRREFLMFHRDIGVLFSFPILIFLISGTSLVYYKEALATLSFLTFSEPVIVNKPVVSPGKIDWVIAISNAYKAFPEGTAHLVSWPKTKAIPGLIRMRQKEEWHQTGQTNVYIAPITSAVVGVKDALQLSRGEKAFNYLYPLHSAGIGGRLYDVFAFLSGLALSALGLGGLYTFISRNKKRKKI